MTVFMDMTQENNVWVYPSIVVHFEDGTKKTFKYVQSVYIGSENLSVSVVKPGKKPSKDKTLKNVKFFSIANA